MKAVGSPSHLDFTCKPLENRSGETRIRTGDTMIFSHVLYQLSYLAVQRYAREGV